MDSVISKDRKLHIVTGASRWAKRVSVCPAWDDKTMSCMLDKQKVLFKKRGENNGY